MTFPYPVERVPGAQALQKLDELRARGQGVPLILGSEGDFGLLCENQEFIEDEPEALIAQAQALDAAAWLAERYADVGGEYEDEEAGEDEEDDEDDDVLPWPESAAEASPEARLSAHCDVLSKKPHAAVVLATLPARENWQAICHLKAGGWNECPFPHEQAAVYKLWNERYGAELACVTSDVVEMTVTRPPTTREAALELAQQQYHFCPDIVDQGVGSVQALAKSLLFAPVWYFWWD